MQQSAYYRPSGKFTAGGIILCLLLGMLPALVLSPLYAWAITEITSVYLSVFVCLIFGFAIGLDVGIGVEKAHLRHPALSVFLGLLCAAVAFYLHWVCYMALLIAAAGPEAGLSTAQAALTLLTSPGVLFEEIMELNRYGAWTLKNETVNGEMLLGVWGAEFLLILAPSAYMARKKAAAPYSEIGKTWMKKEDLPHTLEHSDDKAGLIQSLEHGSLDRLLALPVSDDPYRGLRLTAYSCDDDPDAYLTVTRIKPKRKVKKGKKPELHENKVATFLKLSNAQVREIKDHLLRQEQARPEAVPA